MTKMQDLIGRAWGRFQIIEERGRGGMAVVFKAYDSVLQRTVALKVLLPSLVSNEEFTIRFQREAITAANLRHQNVVIIYDVGSHEAFQYIVMEYLNGLTLQQEIAQKGALPITRAMLILRQTADALDHAHEQQLVHRDIKPANVIIDAKDHVTLTDFGLVKAARSSTITGEGAAVGTLAYMSPEQAGGQELDRRSDVYSLGVVVYEMLAGETPFSGTTPYQTLHSLMYQPPPPLSRLKPEIQPGLEPVICKALSKEPRNRFGTAGEFYRALSIAAGLGSSSDSVPRLRSELREANLFVVTSDGLEYPLREGRVTIGRETGNDIVLPVRQVSRHHAQVHCSPSVCSIMDLRSTNGTFVNGLAIPPRTQQPIRAGDVLQIGTVMLKVTRPPRSGLPSMRTTYIELKADERISGATPVE
jgi:serine/threonine protein kinase